MANNQDKQEANLREECWGYSTDEFKKSLTEIRDLRAPLRLKRYRNASEGADSDEHPEQNSEQESSHRAKRTLNTGALRALGAAGEVVGGCGPPSHRRESGGVSRRRAPAFFQPGEQGWGVGTVSLLSTCASRHSSDCSPLL